MERDQLADILHRTQDQQEDDFQRLQQHLELQLKQQLQQQYRQVNLILVEDDFIKSDNEFSNQSSIFLLGFSYNFKPLF